MFATGLSTDFVFILFFHSQMAAFLFILYFSKKLTAKKGFMLFVCLKYSKAVM